MVLSSLLLAVCSSLLLLPVSSFMQTTELPPPDYFVQFGWVLMLIPQHTPGASCGCWRTAKIPTRLLYPSFWSFPITPHDGCIICKLVVADVLCRDDVQGEEERGQHCSLRCSCATDYNVRSDVLQPDILLSVSEVVLDPGSQAGSIHILDSFS